MSRCKSPFRSVAMLAAVFAVAAVACENKPAPGDDGVTPPGDDGTQPPGERKAAVPSDHALYDRFEGTGFANACNADNDCYKAGCSSEVCSATPGVITTCEVLPVSLPAGTECGCVSSECIWWNAEGLTLPPVETPAEESCATVLCEPPKVCIEYYGIAGPSGPKFVSCEIRCSEDKDCPEDQQCVTIADGPGQVCRPPGQ